MEFHCSDIKDWHAEGAVSILSLYCHYTVTILSAVAILSLYCLYTVAILSIYCYYTATILSLYCRYAVAIPVAMLLLYCCYTVVLLLLYCCYVLAFDPKQMTFWFNAHSPTDFSTRAPEYLRCLTGMMGGKIGSRVSLYPLALVMYLLYSIFNWFIWLHSNQIDHIDRV